MEDTLDLRDYLAVLMRRKTTVIAVTGVVVAVALGLTVLQTPVYEARAELLVESLRRSEDTTLESILLGDSVIETERRVITSRPVTERVLADLDLDMTPTNLVKKVSTSIVRDAFVINISVSDPDPELATAIANSYADSYLEHRRDRAVTELLAAQDDLNRRAEDLRERIAGLDAQIEAAQQPAASPDEVDQPPTTPTTDTSALEAERQSLLAQLAQVEASTLDTSAGQDLVRGGGEVLVPAEVPSSPASPKPLRTGVLALVLGAMLGVGLAFLRDHLDDVIRGDEDIRRISDSAPIIGRITHWTDPRADERLITLVDPRDAASEEFRGLSANVRFALINRVRPEVAGRRGADKAGSALAQQSILVTSSTPGEGKSTTAANLAVAAAMAGLRVVLVEADLRQPTLAERFGFPAGTGMSDLLVSSELLDAPDKIATHLVNVGQPNLRVLPAGTVPPNPTELLATPQMRRLDDILRRAADLVIYDCPPLLPVADALEMSAIVDAALVVVRTGECTRRELQHAIERLRAVDAPVGGFVMNDLTDGAGTGYGYYGYGSKRHTYPARIAEPGSTPVGTAPNEPGRTASARPSTAPGQTATQDARSPAADPTPADVRSPAADPTPPNGAPSAQEPKLPKPPAPASSELPWHG